MGGRERIAKKIKAQLKPLTLIKLGRQNTIRMFEKNEANRC